MVSRTTSNRSPIVFPTHPLLNGPPLRLVTSLSVLRRSAPWQLAQLALYAAAPRLAWASVNTPCAVDRVSCACAAQTPTSTETNITAMWTFMNYPVSSSLLQILENG